MLLIRHLGVSSRIDLSSHPDGAVFGLNARSFVQNPLGPRRFSLGPIPPGVNTPAKFRLTTYSFAIFFIYLSVLPGYCLRRTVS